mgnify:CR=1 FL=1
MLAQRQPQRERRAAAFPGLPAAVRTQSLDAGAHLMAPARTLLDAAGVPYEPDVGVGAAGHMLAEMIENAGADMVITYHAKQWAERR